MPPVARHAVRFVLLVAAYQLGAYVALWFVQSPDDVTLIWPPSGVVYSALLLYGPRWWPFVAVSVLLTHWLMAPVPALFVPYSVAANVLGGLIGTGFVRRFDPLAAEKYTLPGSFNLLFGGILMVAVSAVIGAAGMVHAGMVPSDDVFAASMRWAMGDLFGIVTVGPAVLLAGRGRDFGLRGSHGLYGGRLEKLSWVVIVLLSLGAIGWASQYSGAYALGLAFMPMALLLWSAVRFEPLFTAAANVAFAMLVATIAGLGIGGFTPPTGLADVAVLIGFLCVLALTPQVLTVAAHENRISTLRLIKRANTDALTGMPNRTAFEARVRALSHREPNEPMALAYLDLDQFKLINDTLSHQAGDELIRALGGALQSRIGPHDVIARIGGDEFAILLRHCPPADADERSQRLRDAVAEFRFVTKLGHVAATTASLGVVTFTGEHTDFAQLLAQADTACFAAKERGGNRTEVLSPGRGAAVEERSSAMRWALRLNEAIEQDRFVLHCQSIAPLRTLSGTARHFEILLRLREPETGELLPPGRFIPAAERFGFGTRLDSHVLDRTLQWFADHPEARARVSSCSINLCAASVDDDRFLTFLQKRLEKSPLRPHQLCFELTETSALRDLARAQNFIQSVRKLGCRFALDDFGTGFCSFGYLRSLDVDYFKIDGSFVREIEDSPLSLAIVHSIGNIARVIGKQTIAECAETEAIRARLIDLGIDYAQGYAVDEPMPIERYFAERPEPAKV